MLNETSEITRIEAFKKLERRVSKLEKKFLKFEKEQKKNQKK